MALDGTGRPPESPAALREELDRLRQSAAAAQTRTDRVRDLERQVQQFSARRPEERGATATRSDLDALAGQLRGEIRDLARALKDVQSPLPRILAMTRDVREAMTGIQTSQGQTSDALHRLEQASESLAITAAIWSCWLKRARATTTPSPKTRTRRFKPPTLASRELNLPPAPKTAGARGRRWAAD